MGTAEDLPGKTLQTGVTGLGAHLQGNSTLFRFRAATADINSSHADSKAVSAGTELPEILAIRVILELFCDCLLSVSRKEGLGSMVV